MNISAPFIARPVATILLTIGIVLAGGLAFFDLPVAPLPQIDSPTISVSASLAGADPDTVATSVTEPLERHLGAIADVTEMTSESSTGSSRITLQFDLNRDINGAARDVEAAINAASADLPSGLRSNPSYRKFNSADAPILVIALTSKSLTRAKLYDDASNILSQPLSQVEGVGEVELGGGAAPAVRAELSPQALFKYGIGLEDVRAAIANANAHSPKGTIDNNGTHYQLDTNDQALHAADYRPLVVAYRNNTAVRLSDVGHVIDSIEDLHNLGLLNGSDSIMMIVFREPGANVVQVADRVKAELPKLMLSLPSDVRYTIVNDRSLSIASSLRDTEFTLLFSVLLVVLVVYWFLRNAQATIIPAITVPVSIIGTFGLMYLCGFSLDIMSLMALTIATGFVVDDAIVVMENIERHIEEGMLPLAAAFRGAREVGFTVLSISLSLIAVFIPILLMGGVIGRLFREFAVTLSLAILISMVIALTTTPMLCGLLLQGKREIKHNRWLEHLNRNYVHSLDWALRHGGLLMVILAATIALNVYLFGAVPKGFFPEQDTGRLQGAVMADQAISFQSMSKKLRAISAIVQADPAVSEVAINLGAGGGGGFSKGSFSSANMFIGLKPKSVRHLTAQQVAARLRPKLAHIPGAMVFMQVPQEIHTGGRQGNALYQYTLQGDSTADVYKWTPKLVAALQDDPRLTDVGSDLQTKGLETDLHINRDRVAQFGLNIQDIDSTLDDAFGQRTVSTVYEQQNQYRVVMEIDPKYQQSPEMLKQIWISTSGSASGTAASNLVTASSGTAGATAVRNAATNSIATSGAASGSAGSAVSTSQETMIPLSAVATYKPGLTALTVEHTGPFVSTTISFNTAPGVSLGQAQQAFEQAEAKIRMPTTISGQFTGTASLFSQFSSNLVLLILAALVAVYLVLGILYESFIHPITIISTLPSAGVGAVLALILFGTQFSLIALIGVLLLIGIVKKNAIMMIDFALVAEREEGLSSHQAILKACRMRFRPILMTTASAMFGALPLALGIGSGSEFRQPLGISIVGGLLISQVLTLYTTPVIYLYLDKFRHFTMRAWRSNPGIAE